MKLILLDFLFAQELVYDVLGDVEALWLESELAVDIDDPLEEECSRGVSDFCLNFGNVFVVDHELDFLLLHVFEVLLRVLGDGLRVLDFESINLRHLRHFSLQVVHHPLLVDSRDPFCVIRGRRLRNVDALLLFFIGRHC